MTKQENSYPLGETRFPNSGVGFDLTRPHPSMSCLPFLRCRPPPGQAALTFLPFHALHSFPTPWEINMSFTTPGSPTEFHPVRTFPRYGLGWDWLIPRHTQAPNSGEQVSPTEWSRLPVLFLLFCCQECPLHLLWLPQPWGPCYQSTVSSQDLPVQPVTIFSLFAGT